MSAGELLKQANQLKRSGRLDEAIALYRKAIELNPDFGWTYYYLAEALAEKKVINQAIVQLNIALKIHPSNYLFKALEKKLISQLSSIPSGKNFPNCAIRDVKYNETTMKKSECFSSVYTHAKKSLILLLPLLTIMASYECWR
ncbi:tetratricopeptide repeat protein [Microcoleus sp. B9-D4]|uniref:tetratricopeptide repeat protein n=1 Tax=Microcoleus sp. B9-D4 TaxID=2818711 RepID=UPI002FD63382